MMADPPPENLQKGWRGTYDKVRVILAGELDFLKEFEVFHANAM